MLLQTKVHSGTCHGNTATNCRLVFLRDTSDGIFGLGKLRRIHIGRCYGNEDTSCVVVYAVGHTITQCVILFHKN